MTTIKQHILYSFVFALLGLITTFTNLGTEKLFLGDDVGVNFAFPDSLNSSVNSMWDDYTFPGKSNVPSALAYPFAQFIVGLSRLSLSTFYIVRIQYFLFFFLSSMGMYFFCHLLLKKYSILKGPHLFFAFAAGLLYGYNYFSGVMVSFPLGNYHITYAIFPFVFLAFLHAFFVSTSLAAVFVFSILFSLLLGGNPANTLTIFFIFASYLLVFIKDVRAPKKNFVIAAMLFMLITAYIYLPMVTNEANPYVNVSVDANLDSLNFNSIRTSFFNLIRFQGFHSAETFNYYQALSTSKLLIAGSFLVPFLILLSLALGKITKVENYFLVVSLISLFLAKGTYPPLDGWFLNLFNKVFLLQMYRATYYKLMPFIIFSFCVLLIFGLCKIYKLFKDHNLQLLLVVLPLMILGDSYYILSGHAARRFHLTNIPKEYYDTRNFLMRQPLSFKVLSLPQIPGSVLKWSDSDYYAGVYYQDNIIFDRPVWSTSWFDTSLAPYFTDGTNLAEGLRLLSKYSIKYVLLHKDIPEDFDFEGEQKRSILGQSAYLRSRAVLDSTPSLKVVLENKFLILYELSDASYIPLVHLDVSYSNSHPEAMLQYYRNNASKFTIRLENVSGTVPIRLNESYHPKWVAFNVTPLSKPQNSGEYISPLFGSTKQNNGLPEYSFFDVLPNLLSKKVTVLQRTSHTMCDGYANCWSIDVASLCQNPTNCRVNTDGTYNIDMSLTYEPQYYFMLGLLISKLTLLGFSIYLVVSYLHRRSV